MGETCNALFCILVAGYKLQVSRKMLHRSYAFPRAITKNILFCFEAAGL